MLSYNRHKRVIRKRHFREDWRDTDAQDRRNRIEDRIFDE